MKVKNIILAVLVLLSANVLAQDVILLPPLPQSQVPATQLLDQGEQVVSPTSNQDQRIKDLAQAYENGYVAREREEARMTRRSQEHGKSPGDQVAEMMRAMKDW